MKRYLILLVLMFPTIAHADYILAGGATSQMVELFVEDSSSTTGAGLTGLAYNSGSLTCYYHRSDASSGTSITLATSTLGTYTSGAFKEVSSANMPGVYQFGIPDAAIASGATYVSILCKGATNMRPTALRIRISPAVAIQTNGISGTSIASDGTIASESGTTLGITSGGVDADDQFNNGFAVTIYDAAGLVAAQSCVTDSTNSGDTVVTADDISALLSVGDAYVLRADAGCAARAVSGSITSVTGAVGSVTGNVGGNVVGSVASVTGAVGSVGSGGITTASFAAGAVDSAAMANTITVDFTGNLSGSVGSVTGAIGSLGTTAKSDVNAEMIDVMSTDTLSELSSCPSTSAPTRDKMLQLVYEYFRFRRTASSSQEIIYKDNGSTALCTAPISDNGTLFERSESS